jgi:glutathione S-transferase
MPQYKLTYFDLRGLGEPIRMILHYADQKFEDHRITFEQWPALKPKTPYGQLPVMNVDGVDIAQSCAIARLLAKRHGLAGDGDVESAVLDSLIDFQKDFQGRVTTFFQVVAGRKEGDKDALLKDVFLPAFEEYTPYLEKALANSGSGFFGKKGVTWVDFFIANFTLTTKNIAAAAVAKHPELEKHCKKVHDIPQLQKYLSSRKETQF